MEENRSSFVCFCPIVLYHLSFKIQPLFPPVQGKRLFRCQQLLKKHCIPAMHSRPGSMRFCEIAARSTSSAGAPLHITVLHLLYHNFIFFAIGLTQSSPDFHEICAFYWKARRISPTFLCKNADAQMHKKPPFTGRFCPVI